MAAENISPQSLAERFAATVDAQNMEGDLVGLDSPMSGLIWINPDRLGGKPCFAGTRVPVKAMFDYLEAGDPLQEFLDDFPGVERDQAVAVLELCRNSIQQYAAGK